MKRTLVIGIDFGHHSIKAVAIKSMGNIIQLVGYHELSVPQEIFSANHILDYRKIVKKLKELKKGLPRFSHQVAISVPDQAVISKVLQIERDIDVKEQEFAIHEAFGQQSPIPIEDLSLDFFEVEQQEVNRSATSSFQVYATRKEVVESRVDALKEAGLKPSVIDVQANSLSKVCRLASQKHPDRSNWMLVDIGLKQTSLCTLGGGKEPFHKEFLFGIENMSHPQALPGAMSSNKDPTTLSFAIDLGQKINRNISLYNSMNPQKTVGGIWLSGCGANLSGMVDLLSKQLRLEIVRLNPFDLIEISTKKTMTVESDLASYCLAMGIAISGAEWLEGTHHA